MTYKLLGLSALACLLGACASHSKPVPQSNLIYNAPAQAYALDLGSQVFRGAVKLRESCAPEGSSLDLTDNDGRFFRVDAINLAGNPKIPLPDFADDPTVRELVLRYYTDQVYPGSQIVDGASVNSRMGAGQYSTLKLSGQDRYLGMLIIRRGNFAYALQHVQNSQRPVDMKAVLGVLASDLRVPGAFSGRGLDLQDSTMDIDLKNSTPEQIAEWRKTARCS